MPLDILVFTLIHGKLNIIVGAAGQPSESSSQIIKVQALSRKNPGCRNMRNVYQPQTIAAE
jgi:hypothetical protein